jgi:hypothetical protein
MQKETFFFAKPINNLQGGGYQKTFVRRRFLFYCFLRDFFSFVFVFPSASSSQSRSFRGAWDRPTGKQESKLAPAPPRAASRAY